MFYKQPMGEGVGETDNTPSEWRGKEVISKGVKVKDEEGVKNFFSGYAEDFDSIYGDGKHRNIFDRMMDKLFRQSMYERYKRTIEFLTSNDVETVLDVGPINNQHNFYTNLALKVLDG